MRPKGRISPVQSIPLAPGLYPATIWTVNFARESNGNIIMDKTGQYPGIEITFNVLGTKFKETFHTTPQSQWIWDSISKALRIDNTKESISASAAKGKMLWIMIAGKVYMKDDGDLERNSDGTVKMDSILRMKFYEYIENSFKPAISGDPENNGGFPSGEFLMIRVGDVTMNNTIDLRDFVKPKVNTHQSQTEVDELF